MNNVLSPSLVLVALGAGLALMVSIHTAAAQGSAAPAPKRLLSKMFGQGRVFYTSLGHRGDVWEPAWVDKDGQRKNPAEVSRQYQQHLLGGIRWALGTDSERPE